MNKLLLLFIAIFFSCCLNAQTSLLFENNYPGSRNCLGINADYTISSNAITTTFTNAYLRGKFLDVDLKDASLNKMKIKNRLGSDFNGNIYYRYKTKNSADTNCMYYFYSLNERIHFNTGFPADLFHLYFYGNKPFAGKTADISNFNYRSLQYQQMQFGIMKQISRGKKTFGYAVAVSALNGQNYLDIKTRHGTLYTQADAEYVDMNLFLESKQSDTTRKSFGSSNGGGASANFDFFYAEENKFRIHFSARDLGFIAWNKKSNSFNIDTLYHYEGIVISNILDSIYLDLKSEKDFKDGFKKNKQSKSFITVLPSSYCLSYERNFNEITVEIGGNYILNSNYQPLIFISGDYFFNTQTHAGIQLLYGGYGGFHAGVHIDKDFGKGYIVSAGSAFLDGYILPSSSAAQGAYASIKKIF